MVPQQTSATDTRSVSMPCGQRAINPVFRRICVMPTIVGGGAVEKQNLGSTKRTFGQRKQQPKLRHTGNKYIIRGNTYLYPATLFICTRLDDTPTSLVAWQQFYANTTGSCATIHIVHVTPAVPNGAFFQSCYRIEAMLAVVSLPLLLGPCLVQQTGRRQQGPKATWSSASLCESRAVPGSAT